MFTNFHTNCVCFCSQNCYKMWLKIYSDSVSRRLFQKTNAVLGLSHHHHIASGFWFQVHVRSTQHRRGSKVAFVCDLVTWGQCTSIPAVFHLWCCHLFIELLQNVAKNIGILTQSQGDYFDKQKIISTNKCSFCSFTWSPCRCIPAEFHRQCHRRPECDLSSTWHCSAWSTGFRPLAGFWTTSACG